MMKKLGMQTLSVLASEMSTLSAKPSRYRTLSEHLFAREVEGAHYL